MQLGPFEHLLRSHSIVGDGFFVEALTDTFRSSVIEITSVECGVVGVGNVEGFD